MKKAASIFIILTLVLTVSCEKDLELAKWEEISVIYGLINIRDSAQYLRINRVFSTEDDPLNYTQINDSVNYPDNAFEVYLEEYKDGNLVGEAVAYFPVDREKEPGLFSSTSNCVYKTRTRINKDSEYRLRVINRDSGKEVWGQASVLGSYTLEESFYYERAYYRVNYPAEPMPDYEGSLDPYDHEHYIVRFLYWEYKDGETFYKYVDWVPTINPLKDINDDDTAYQLFDAYWEYLAENIQVDPALKRKVRGVD